MSQSPPKTVSTIESPPTTILGILSRLGPGMIIAGSIVGSGELIGTTLTGAKSGYWLLWLILLGCVIKVFVQVEFGRFSICNSVTTMDGLNQIPGPRFPIPGSHGLNGKTVSGSWIIWYWVLMFAASIGQLGGIVGLVGQSLAMTIPITRLGSLEDQFRQTEIQLTLAKARLAKADKSNDSQVIAAFQKSESKLSARRDALELELAPFGPLRDEKGKINTRSRDATYWAIAITAVTSLMLVVGRYSLIQRATTWLVAGFTLVSVLAVLFLQRLPEFAMSWPDLVNALRFRLPPAPEYDPQKALSNALATFGIIGVGATELISYPYWCLEHGYARYTGTYDNTSAWNLRARGWLNVMKWDAWCSMLVYTFATAAFYILGAATLGKFKLAPEGADVVRTLMVMYEPVFGNWASPLFLLGGFAVLYSTFFVASAGHARVVSDALNVMGLASTEETASRRRVILLSGLFPILSLLIFLFVPAPVFLILLSGLMQAMMLPMLAFAALYFRWYRCDSKVAPGRVWDFFLIASSIGMLVSGGCAAYVEIAKLFAN
jgi:Mn2+/Fe2+ NRAMP family transporter